MERDLTPSTTLRRAARKELERLQRTQTRLEEQRDDLEARIEELTADLKKLAERMALLTEVAGEVDTGPELTEITSGRLRKTLKGAAIRERAARRVFISHGAGQELHYRRWMELLLEEGVEISGRDPSATFLTNLGRSPVVVRGSEPGTYVIDDSAPAALRRELGEKEAELRDVTEVMAREDSDPVQLRDHRDQLVSEIKRLERLIAEAERVLAPVEADGRADLPRAA